MGVDGALAAREGKAGNPAGRKSRTGVKRAPPNPLASFFRPTRRSCPSLPSCSLSDGSATRPRRLLVAPAFLPCPHEDVRGAKHVADLLVRHNDVISTSDQGGERHVATVCPARRARPFLGHSRVLVDGEGLRECRAAARASADR